MRFVDTNIFIRFLTQDHPTRSRACTRLLEKAEAGLEQLTTTESVVSEIVHVLCSPRLYRQPLPEVAAKLIALLKTCRIHLSHKNTVLYGLKLCSQFKLDFEDALLIAHMLRTNAKEIFSYDEEFDKVKEITRLEP